MPYIARDRLIAKSSDSVYKLVILAARRALEIAEGQPKLVESNPATKPSTIALQEIFEGRVQARKIKAKE
jgi:DNA-directed RNA polymerase omega subunit